MANGKEYWPGDRKLSDTVYRGWSARIMVTLELTGTV